MQEQHKLLEENLQKWMEEGNEKQVDDILVIGFGLSANRHKQNTP
jgi:hypothetical protein